MDIRQFLSGGPTKATPQKNAIQKKGAATNEAPKKANSVSSKKKSSKSKAQKAILPLPLPKASPDFSYVDNSKGTHTDEPPNAGKVEIPEGAPNCMLGIIFSASGTLNSITRAMLRDLIDKYGGRLTSTVSPKTDIFIRGVRDVGKSKLESAVDKGIPIIDEDGFFYIISKSMPTKQKQLKVDNNKLKEDEKKLKEGNKMQLQQKSTLLQSYKQEEIHRIQVLSDSQPKQNASVVPLVKVDPYSESQPSFSNANLPTEQLFTEKYRPTEFGELVGNKDGIAKLRDFLRNFEKKEKKAVIIYGPPGIGKTTAAVISAKAAGYHAIEFNASDTRNKSAVESVARDIFSNQSLFKYNGENSNHIKSCIIFDEIDGMSSGDRGGIQVLTEFVKKSKIPIICICNDRFNKKLQTLSKYAEDIPFSAPNQREIAERIDHICRSESIPMNRAKFISVTSKNAGDIRSALNSLQLWSSGVENTCEKDITKCDPFEATIEMLNPKTPFEKKIDAFFTDYDAMPAYVHHFCGMNQKDYHGWFDAIDAMAYGNEIETAIRSENAWDLLNPLGIISSVYPATICPCKIRPKKSWPDDFAKGTKINSLYKCLGDISMRCRRSAGVSRNAFRAELAELIPMRLNTLLIEKKESEALDFLDSLELIKDDLARLTEIVSFGLNNYNEVSATAKAKFTKLYGENHTTANKQYANPEDERSDYLIKSSTKKKGKK